MLPLLIGPIAGVLGQVIDKMFPDPAKAEEAKRQLVELQLKGELDVLTASLSAIIAEAQSPDPWTSRARPTFLYLIYLVILLCVAGSILGIWWPDRVTTASQNLANLLGAIPADLWWLFGAGYLGYSAGRSFDKWKSGGR